MTWWLWVLVGWSAGAVVVAGFLGRLLRRHDPGVPDGEPIDQVVMRTSWSRDRRAGRERTVSALSPKS